ncbi:FkbM family methyltransferase [Soonwooa sp.]|uniref:FkbM family methyltransferase n=1 Tax=Soonwooa sp. TaxID=1938592 RepID=UPI00261FCBF6|nr:FkbM family methyltransferase [Soonwooa sp.]
MSVYSNLAEYLQYISPSFYKSRYFKKLKNLNQNNIIKRKVEPEFLWIKNYLNKDSVFIDIGANVGAYLYVLENHLKPKNIFAFEPNKELNSKLQRLFPNMHVFSSALSDENTTAEFKIPIIKGQKVHTRGTLQTQIKEKDEENTILQSVQVVKMDDLTLQTSKIDFIKIDVEGNEMKTLRGAKQTILKHRPTLMVEMEQRHHEEKLWTLISEIENWGFTANYLDRDTLTLKRLTEEFILLQDANNVKNYQFYINNIIFIPN